MHAGNTCCAHSVGESGNGGNLQKKRMKLTAATHRTKRLIEIKDETKK